MAVNWEKVTLGLQAAHNVFNAYSNYRYQQSQIGLSEEQIEYANQLREFESQIAKQNATFLDFDKKTVTARATQLKDDIDKKVTATKAEQVATFAGRGFDVPESASVTEFLDETDRLGKLDRQTINENLRNDLFALDVRQYNILSGDAATNLQHKLNVDIAQKQNELSKEQAKDNKKDSLIGTALNLVAGLL